MEVNKEEVENAFKFLIDNRGASSKFLDRKRLKASVKSINNASNIGFNSKAIKKMAETIIFSDQYDILTRRQLLYSMMPAKNEFPYEIIPLALSSANTVPTSPSWQAAVLRWLCGLIDYEIIDVSHSMLHMCYPIIFILLTHLNVCGFACKLLCKLTRREDVTKHRIQVILRLNGNPGFCEIVPHLIRIYKIYRPDMIACTVGFASPLPRISGDLQASFAATQVRLQEEISEETVSTDKGFWPDQKLTKKKRNGFQLPSAIPYPEVILYTTKIEEQKAYKINVMQYSSLKELASTITRWRSWQWPTSPSSMLWKPAALALFRPHEKHLKISITNWLEIALRTEIVNGCCKSSKRQSQLLETVIALAENMDTNVPVIYHFIIELLVKWDRYTHTEQVLKLLPFVPFVSPAFFFERVFDVVSFLLVENSSVSSWCNVTSAMGELAKNWALEEVQVDTVRKKWPLTLDRSSPIDGLFFLSQQMSRIFLLSIVKFKYHPAILNSVLRFYDQVNLYCEQLELPFFIVPSPAVVFSITARGGPFIQHKMGTVIANYRDYVKRVKEFSGSVNQEFIRSVTLSSIPTINSCVRIFLDSTVGARSFNGVWMEDFSNLFDEDILKKVRKLPNISLYGGVDYNVIYSSLFGMKKLDEMDTDESEKASDQLHEVLDALGNVNLDGIKKCGLAYNAFDE